MATGIVTPDGQRPIIKMQRTEMVEYLVALEKRDPGILEQIRKETQRVGPQSFATVLPLFVREAMDEARKVHEQMRLMIGVIDEAIDQSKLGR